MSPDPCEVAWRARRPLANLDHSLPKGLWLAPPPGISGAGRPADPGRGGSLAHCLEGPSFQAGLALGVLFTGRDTRGRAVRQGLGQEGSIPGRGDPGTTGRSPCSHEGCGLG